MQANPLVRLVDRAWGRLDRLAGTDAMRAVREGLLWIVPSLLVSAGFLVAAVVLDALGLQGSLSSALLRLHQEISHILPPVIAASIGYMLSIRHRLPRLPVAFLCFAYVAIASAMLQEHPRAAATLILFIAIASPLINVPIMARLASRPWTRIAHNDIVSSNVREALNLIVPGLLTAMLLALVLYTLVQTPLLNWMNATPQLPLTDHPYQSGMLVTGLNSLLWFFGIHGYHALQPIFQSLELAVTLNAADVQAGGSGAHVLNISLLSAFVFIGGSGGTLSLVLAILLLCRNQSLRLLAWASVPIALLNVNEILLFGLPIILNPRLALPFFLVPMVNVTLAQAVVQLGLVSPVVAHLPLTSPVLLNAYLATGGDPAAVVLQLALVALGVLIYAPFVRAFGAAGSAGGETIHIRSLDTTFTQLHEEASLYANDPIVLASGFRKAQREQNKRIREISEYDFHLEYQPQVSLHSGLCVGCEALLRARDRQGKAQMPWEFIRWLEQAQLMKDLDLWVAAEAVAQSLRWQAEGLRLPITINVTGHSLEDADTVRKMVDIVATANGRVSIELTEQVFAGNLERVRAAMDEFHKVGAKVYIDDFGTGYSALSYLHRFDIDAIKIDRSFVLAQQHPKGAKVMDGLMRFADALGLGIVVEGVETEEQIRALGRERNLTIQGWYFSKALSPDALSAYARCLEAAPRPACAAV